MVKLDILCIQSKYCKGNYQIYLVIKVKWNNQEINE